MTWMNNDYRAYPARCFSFHREAVLISPTSMELGAWKTSAAALEELDMLRKFRFLIRSNPGVDQRMDHLMKSHTFRGRVVQNSLGDWIAMFSAKPAIVSDLLTNNPELSDILQSECQ